MNKNNHKVRPRISITREAYAAVRHIAADEGPRIEAGTIIARAVDEYLARHRRRAAKRR